MDSISLLILTPLLFLTLNKILTITILLKFDLFNMMVALPRTPAPLARTASTRWESVSTVSNHPL